MGTTLTLRLYKNDIAPTPQTTLAEFTAASFPGYSDRVISSDWTPPTIDGAGQAVTRTPALSWTRQAGVGTETIYGYVMFWTDAGGNTVFAAERFATPRLLTAAGQSLTVQALLYVFAAFN